jgi:multidrug efflux pump
LNVAFRALTVTYERLLRRSLQRPLWVAAGLAALTASAVLTFRSLPTEFAPVADVGFAVVGIDAAEGTGLEAMEGYGLQLERLVQDEMERVGDISRVMLRIPGVGGANAATGDVNTARALLVLEDWRDRQRTASEITTSLVRQANLIPGVQAFGSQPGSLGRRGFGKPVQAVIGGPDYESLSAWSATLVERARANPGLIGVDTNYTERKVQLRVVNDRDRAADLGVSLDAVGRTLETMLGSRVVTTYVDRGREYPIILQGEKSQRQAGDDALNIAVRSDTTGDLVPLSSIVRLEEEATAMKLNRFNRLRAVKISAGLAPGYTMGEAVRWFRETAATELPAGATLTFDGESAEYVKGGQQLYVTFAFALSIVFLVLAAQFESFRLPVIVLTTVPLALIGAIPALKLHGEAVNIFSQIACVLLIGIAAKNGVLIVEFANQMRSRGKERLEAVVFASLARLRPILMTSLCTAFGALPFLLASGAGAEQRRPIGVVVFYGTMGSVVLTLFVVPIAYLLVSRKSEPESANP